MTFLKKIKSGNHTYLAEVKSIRDGDKVRHKFIRYVGKEVDGKTVLSGSIGSAQVTDVIIYGPLLVLNDIALKLGMSEIFEEQTPYILSLAFAHCIEPGSLASIEKWFKRTDLQHILGLENVTYSKLLEALDYLEGRGKIIQQKLFDSAKRTFDLKPDHLFYDATNIYFYGSCCPLAKRGHSKEGKDNEQIQIGLAVTKDEKIPIFHKVFEGNIHDAKTVRHLFDDFELNDRAWIVWDRGITSKENIIDAMKEKFHVLCGLPLDINVKKIVEIELASGELVNFNNRVPLTKSTLYARQMEYSFDGIKGYLTICYNEKEKVAIKERRYALIQSALLNLQENKPIPDGIRKYFSYKKVNPEALRDAEKYDGISAIFSTKKIPCGEILNAYFDKDKVEKAFKSMKSTLEIRPIRHWLTERVKSHVFICYIAYYMLSILEYRLRGLNMTAPKALDILKTMYKVNMIDPKTKNQFTKVVMLNKEQKDVLKAVNKQLLKCSQ